MSVSRNLILCAGLALGICLPSAAQQIRAGYLSNENSVPMRNVTRPGNPEARDRYRTTARADTEVIHGDGYTPFMLSFVSPLQVPPRDFDVGGLRLSIIYGECVNFDGIDIGLVGRAVGHGNGLFLNGLATIIDGDSIGLQFGLVNYVSGNFGGLQAGLINYSTAGQAFQFGFYNGADHIEGFQCGVINMTRTMIGLQIGLINVIQNNDVPFMPIINCYF